MPHLTDLASIVTIVGGLVATGTALTLAFRNVVKQILDAYLRDDKGWFALYQRMTDERITHLERAGEARR